MNSMHFTFYIEKSMKCMNERENILLHVNHYVQHKKHTDN